MRKVKRRLGRSPAMKHEKRDPSAHTKPEVEQVFPPPNQRVAAEQDLLAYVRKNPFSSSKSNRCTYYSPSHVDFGQLTDMGLPPNDYYQNLIQEICDQGIPDTTKTKEMKNACHGSAIQTCSQFVEPASGLAIDESMMVDLLSDDAQWQAIDSISEVDKFLPSTDTEEKEIIKEKKNRRTFPNSVQISETPRVKRIAEKYSKFKRNNIELRKLEERVVCLEYDIFDVNSDDPAVPIQKMRAFFSIKTNNNQENDNKDNITFIPSEVKRNFNIEDGDLQKLNKKEIEIIDEEIAENRSILEDLRRVLRRKQALEVKKKQQTLDLMYLYEMAKRESPPVRDDYSNTNLLSKAELQEIKDLILKKCASSVYGINRKTVKCTQGDATGDANCVISDSLTCELLREIRKV